MSKFKPRNLLLVVALSLAVALLLIIALRYRPAVDLPKLVESMPQGVDLALSDLDYTHIEDGRARWHLVAQQVARQGGSGEIDLQNPQLSFFAEDGSTRASLQAGRGEVSSDYQVVSLKQQVVLHSSSGYTLYAEQLDYDHATRMATTDLPVKMISKRASLEGVGLRFNLQQQRLQLLSSVRGSFDANQ